MVTIFKLFTFHIICKRWNMSMFFLPTLLSYLFNGSLISMISEDEDCIPNTTNEQTSNSRLISRWYILTFSTQCNKHTLAVLLIVFAFIHYMMSSNIFAFAITWITFVPILINSYDYLVDMCGLPCKIWNYF
jgi:hypothetical protein